MQAQVAERLRELKTEFAAGQQMLAELETKQADLRQTLLRISGAIQVLEELLAAPTPFPTNDVPPVAVGQPEAATP